MADVTISYKGASVATMDASGTTTLETEGKYCEDDISVVYVKPGGTTPTGTKNISITSNGTTTEDVTDYATAEITTSVVTTRTASGTVTNTGYISFAISSPGSWKALKVARDSGSGYDCVLQIIAGRSILKGVYKGMASSSSTFFGYYEITTSGTGSANAFIYVSGNTIKITKPTDSRAFITGNKYVLELYY